jgi:hypothetical protein
MSLYAVALRFPFTGTRVHSPNHEKTVIQTHFMNLTMNSYCADVAFRVSLELVSECCNRGQIIFTYFNTPGCCSVSLCGLLLRGWAVVSPRCFNFTITALTVDRGSSSRAEIWWTDLLERWHSATLKVTELFSKAILLPMFVYRDWCVTYKHIYSVI